MSIDLVKHEHDHETKISSHIDPPGMLAMQRVSMKHVFPKNVEDVNRFS